MNQPSLVRDIIGFFIGGVSAAVAAGLVFVAFFPLPTENDPRNHVGRTFVMLAVVMFLCGGFIGRRGFSAEALSDLLPSIIGTYAVAGLLPLFSGLSLSEIAPDRKSVV